MDNAKGLSKENRDSTPADFMVARELTGMSQRQLAERMGVQPVTANRWEKPSEAPLSVVPPQRAWEFLGKENALQDDCTFDAIHDIEVESEKAGHVPRRVTIVYWKSQKDYDEVSGKAEPYWRANSVARRIRQEVFSLELARNVRFVFGTSPEGRAITMQGKAMQVDF